MRGLNPKREEEPLSRDRKTNLKKSGFVSLRYRFILITSLMLLVLLTTLALVLGFLQTRTIRSRIEKQGMAIAKNLAAVSVDHLITYNYIALEKLVNQAVNNPEIIYVIIHDKEGRVAGYSRRPDLQHKVLTDAISLNAIEAMDPFVTIHTPPSGLTPVMDVAVPVYLRDSRERWGTIRVCLSLELMYQQIHQTRWIILILGSFALAIGILISNWAAQRVTRPLEALVKATIEAGQGNFQQTISIHTRDEVEILAYNFSLMVQEILAQKQQLENQLKEIKQLQQYAEKIVATMSDGLLAVDMKGVVTAINPAAQAILGLSPGIIVTGCHVLELFSTLRPLADYIQKSLKNPSGGHQCEIHLPKEKETQVLIAGAGILESDQGEPHQIIFNLNDITLLKKMGAQIRQTQRLADLGTLAAGMAHEIRNPLSAIKTYVALLPKKIDKPGFLEKFQRTVPREINRLNTLIEEMLELSRPPKYNFQRTDIKRLIQQSIELLEANFKNRNIDCQREIPDGLPGIMIDSDQLEKAFINLMQNSAQAMPDGGTITINVRHKDKWIILDFWDTGHGFLPELAKNIFTPFFTTKAKGTGLGLAITHKVISEHGGQIEATSQKGKGSCFSIRLPHGQH